MRLSNDISPRRIAADRGARVLALLLEVRAMNRGISGEYYLRISDYAAKHFSFKYKLSYDLLIDIARDTLLKGLPIENKPYHFKAIKYEIIKYMQRQEDAFAVILNKTPNWRIIKRMKNSIWKKNNREKRSEEKRRYRDHNREKLREKAIEYRHRKKQEELCQKASTAA